MSGGERLEGQALSSAARKEAEARVDKILASVDHVAEASILAKDVLETLSKMWAERGFSPEQCVFSLALVTIQCRETFPSGKERFDAVAREAQASYAATK